MRLVIVSSALAYVYNMTVWMCDYNDIYKFALVVHFLKKFLIVVLIEKTLGTPAIDYAMDSIWKALPRL